MIPYPRASLLSHYFNNNPVDKPDETLKKLHEEGVVSELKELSSVKGSSPF